MIFKNLPLFAAALLLASVPLFAEEKPQLPMQELSPGVYQIGKLHLDKNTGTITFPARVNMDEGNLEYLLVTPQGSAHESLLVTDVQPTDLHFAMLLLGAKGSGIYAPAPADAPPPQLNGEYLKHAPQLKGDAITISAILKKDGAETKVPIEDWLLDTETKKSPAHGPWIYSGSMFAEDKFLAQIEGCFAALVTNPSALINNPRKDNDNDSVWIPNKKTVPPKETQIEVSIHLDAPKK